MEIEKIKEIESKAKSIPNSEGVNPQTKEERKSTRGRRPDTPEQKAAKAQAKASGKDVKSPGERPAASTSVQINEQRVKQTAKILELPANIISGACVSWTKSSKAAMRPDKKESICTAWAMILEIYFPDFLNDPKILALITAAVVSGEYGMQVYAVKKLVDLGELAPDQAMTIKKSAGQTAQESVTQTPGNTQQGPPIVQMAPEPMN